MTLTGDFHMTQNEMVLSWLRKAPISPMEALNELGVYRLASRINDLRNDGHDIKTMRHTIVNRYGEEIRVARYVLTGEKTDVATKSKAKVGQSGEGEEKPSPSRLGSWLRLLRLRND
jgi:hypothetical protein